MSYQPPEQQPPQYPQQPQQPQYAPPQQQIYVAAAMTTTPSNGAAITAMILGIVAVAIGIWMLIPFIGIVFAMLAFVPVVLAVVFGHVGLNRSKQTGAGRGIALTGMILGYSTLALMVVVTVFWVSIGLTSSAGW